jgi:hypothetical protein
MKSRAKGQPAGRGVRSAGVPLRRAAQSVSVKEKRLKRFPTVTLVCVDGRSPLLALRAIHDSTTRAGCEFARSLAFTNAGLPPGSASFSLPENTELVELEGLNSIESYDDFLIKGLHSFIQTDFALIVQWDGFVLSPANWKSDFFEYDYIGAVWPWQPPSFQVGNGGFSLRSKKLLQALQDFRVISHHPEDRAICQTYRDLLEREFQVRFAPPEVADLFSFERHPHSGSFGFHGFFNFHRVFSPVELRERLSELPSFVYGGIDSTELAHNLARAGDDANAKEVLKRLLRFKLGTGLPGEFQAD